MLGPVFYLELLLGNRRGRISLLRQLYTGWLVVQFLVLFLAHKGLLWRIPDSNPQEFVESYFRSFLTLHFLLLCLTAPVLVAGSITDEKAQRTLQHLFTADLTSWEIVVGKVLGRLTQIVLIACAGLPMLCFVGGYGGVGWPTLLACVVLSAALLFVLGGLSVWASVHCRQTRDAVLRVYLWCGLATVGAWAGLKWGIPYALARSNTAALLAQTLVAVRDLLRGLDPLAILTTLWGTNDWGVFVRSLFAPVMLCGGVGGIAMGLAVWRLRPVALRQMEGTVQTTRKVKARAAVDEDDPLRWRERVPGRKWGRRLAAAVLCAATIGSSLLIGNLGQPELYLLQGWLASLLISLVIGIRASGAVSSEREQKTWDSVLLTPLDTWDLVTDKLMGTLQGYYPLLLAYLVPALILSGSQGLVALIYTAAVAALGLTAVYYMAATGIYFSVNTNSSWQSLVKTLTFGYGYCLGCLSLLAFGYVVLSCAFVPIFLVLRLTGVKNVSEVASLVLCLLTCFILVKWLLQAANNRIYYAKNYVDVNERYGRTLERSLTRALRKQALIQEERRKARTEQLAVAANTAAAETAS
jgi:ABC-type transport system involved in multi-copper enzyme maturation permease subunit